MKPTQFRKIEEKAFKQRDQIKNGMKDAIARKDNGGIRENKESLDNLISTMRNLKERNES